MSSSSMTHHMSNNITYDDLISSQGGDTAAEGSSSSSFPGDYVVSVETGLEQWLDILLGLAYLTTALVAARRMYTTRAAAGPVASTTPHAGPTASGTSTSNASTSSGASSSSAGGANETTVVTAFYSLILGTSLLRCLWFLIPASVWTPSYTPVAVYAWDADHPSWVGASLSELTVTAGSLTLFSIFILILVYWADILKKYFHPGSRRSLPMVTFLALVSALVVAELVNLVCFLFKAYTTEGMILFNALLLAVVSTVCVCEITIFSHRFRTVLETLGAINQVSTDSQVRRILWITVTGNLFFLTRALLEMIFALLLVVYWRRHGTVARPFSHGWWDTYTLLKYGSEVTILALMLYILQSRFTTRGGASSASTAGRRPEQPAAAGYTKVPNAEYNKAVVV